METALEIGGYRVRLSESEGRRPLFWPAQEYAPFVVPAGQTPDLRFDFRVVRELPALARGELLYDACHGLWKLFQRPDGLLIETLDPRTRRPFNRAIVSPDYSSAEIFTVAEAGGSWNPSKAVNPAVEVCLLTRLAREGGLMLHAAGVDWRGEGFVFAGPSEAGKTTLSDLFVARGALILNDERVIIRGSERGPVVHGTPWCGSNPVANRACAPLRGLYFIRHGAARHELKALAPSRALSLCLKQAFLPHWDLAAMESTMDCAQKLIEKLGGFEYAFLKNPTAVDHLIGRPQDHAESLLSKLA